MERPLGPQIPLRDRYSAAAGDRGAFALRFFGPQLTKMGADPERGVRGPRRRPAPNAYADAKMWLARPDIKNNPATWTPPGTASRQRRPAAVFFIHPTSYLDRAHWNAPLDDAEANARAALFLRGQASAFNEVGASLGAALSPGDVRRVPDRAEADAEQALDFAYRDVARGVRRVPQGSRPDRPIILAGHSQGALHLTRLLRERVAGKPLAKRIVAAYVVGWPVSKTADLPALGLPECATPDQAGCILSWQSFAEPADPSLIARHVRRDHRLRRPAARGHARWSAPTR